MFVGLLQNLFGTPQNNISYTNDFKRKLNEKRPECTKNVPSELEGFRRPNWTFLIGNVVRMV